MATGQQLVNAARKYLGVKYVFGGTTLAGVDCSGLIVAALTDVGARGSFPRVSGDQIKATTPITVQEALNTAGALVWFDGHDAITLGDGKSTIEAVVNPGNKVAIFNAPNRWRKAGLIPGIDYGKKAERVARMQSPVKGWVSSEFSRSRRNPVTGRVEPHLGIDIAAPEGTPYYPVYPGTVIGVGAGLLPGRSGDRNVRVRNPDGETQYYGHGGTASVKVGQKVDHTTPLGTVGQRGNATGPHVHLEIHDKNGVPRDPRIDFAHHGVTPGEPPTGAATTAPKLPLDEGIDMKHTANTYNKPRQSAPKGKWRVLDVKPPSKSGRHISFLGRNTTTALAVVRAAIQGLGPDDYIEFQVFHVKYDPKNGNGPVQALLRHRVTGSQALKGRDSYLDLTRTLGAVPAGHRWRVRAQASKAGVTVSHLSIDVFQ